MSPITPNSGMKKHPLNLDTGAFKESESLYVETPTPIKTPLKSLRNDKLGQIKLTKVKSPALSFAYNSPGSG